MKINRNNNMLGNLIKNYEMYKALQFIKFKYLNRAIAIICYDPIHPIAIKMLSIIRFQ